MSTPNLEPAPPAAPSVRFARREAIFVMSTWALALLWTVGYSYLFGYRTHTGEILGIPLDGLAHLNRSPESLRLIGGIPDWVVWGVILPWAVCFVLTHWFAAWFMKDEDLGEDHDAELAQRIQEEARDA